MIGKELECRECSALCKKCFVAIHESGLTCPWLEACNQYCDALRHADNALAAARKKVTDVLNVAKEIEKSRELEKRNNPVLELF